MPNYKHAKFFNTNDSAYFDTVYSPATTTPVSGIYQCEGCGHEASSTKGHALPPQDHHTHSPAQGKIRWQLVAACIHVKT